MTQKTHASPVEAALDRLAAFEPSEFPVLSLYLNAQPDQHGKDQFHAFIRKELPARGRSFRASSPERESYERDAARIEAYLRDELSPAANGVAIFASSPAGLFEALQLEAPFAQHRFFVGAQPHLYPLARLIDAYPRYAAVLADTRASRIFVFGLRRRLRAEQVVTDTPSRSAAGGWSQMRFQRHVDEQQRHHVKELVETLERVVRDEDPQHLVLAGDEVALPLLRDALPKALAEKVVDVLRLDPATPEHRVLSETLEALRRHEAETDVERVQRLLDEYRAGGLAVVGLRDTRAALAAGQADHVLLAASPAALAAEHGEELAAELVTQARRTSADITFIEDAELLAPAGGVGALLRYRLTPDGPAVAAEEGP